MEDPLPGLWGTYRRTLVLAELHGGEEVHSRRAREAEGLEVGHQVLALPVLLKRREDVAVSRTPVGR